MMKLQCWEFNKCDREKDSLCPAVVQHAGRSCWLVAGTLCGGPVQGDIAKKLGDCKQCDFHIKVKAGHI